MAPLRVAGLMEFHAVDTESLIFRTYCILALEGCNSNLWSFGRPASIAAGKEKGGKNEEDEDVESRALSSRAAGILSCRKKKEQDLMAGPTMILSFSLFEFKPKKGRSLKERRGEVSTQL